jgi:hypothetical protein
MSGMRGGGGKGSPTCHLQRGHICFLSHRCLKRQEHQHRTHLLQPLLERQSSLVHDKLPLSIHNLYEGEVTSAW